MIRKLMLGIFLVSSPLGDALADTTAFTINAGAAIAPPTGHVPFFVRLRGSDTNCNGKTDVDDSASVRPNCAWASFNHPVSCGDFLIVQPAKWTMGTRTHGTVSNCPSTTGGINGTGGIHFAVALCGGADLEGCPVSLIADFLSQGVDSKSNWAWAGFKINGNGHRVIVPRGCNGVVHHFASINNIIYNAAQAVGMNDCGSKQVVGVDYWAAVGTIVQNAALDPICLAPIDVVGPGVFDTNAGTHFYIWGNVSYSHTNKCKSDVEAYMLDTLDVHSVNSQFIVANNIGYNSSRNCIQLFYQGKSTNTPTIKIYNNSCYGNNINTGSDYADGEINLNNSAGTMTWVTTIQRNIAYQPFSTSSGGQRVYAGTFVNNDNLVNGGTGNENIYKANQTSCAGKACGGTNDTTTFGASSTLGTNIYTNPNFNNATDLLANRVGVPNCAGFENVTQCMGYDAESGALANPSVVYDLTATCAGCTGKGYQTPTMTCVSSDSFPDFPVWLKGVIYPHWDSVNRIVIQRAGLVKVPCGM